MSSVRSLLSRLGVSSPELYEPEHLYTALVRCPDLLPKLVDLCVFDLELHAVDPELLDDCAEISRAALRLGEPVTADLGPELASCAGEEADGWDRFRPEPSEPSREDEVEEPDEP